MPHARERTLTLLVIVQAIQLFVLAPLSVEIVIPTWSVGALLAVNVLVALAAVRHLRLAAAAVLAAALVESAALALRVWHPTQSAEALDLAAAFILFVTLTIVESVVVFGPGRVTVHRILGAIAIYLNVAATFAFAYRMIDALGPGRFLTDRPLDAGHTLAALVYFSFTVLTTSGFGDIVPVDAFARALTNVESVFGQLYPATLLARLVTLELQHRGGERRD